MRYLFVLISLTSLIMLAGHSGADTIKLKSGRTINATKCWEDGDLIKCKQNGATVGYQKDDIESVTPKPKKKTPTRFSKVSNTEPIDLYRIEIAFKIQKFSVNSG